MHPLSALLLGLKTERRKKGKRQVDVADKLGVSREVLSRYENGKLPLTLVKAEHLAALLGYRIVWEFRPLDEEEADDGV